MEKYTFIAFFYPNINNVITNIITNIIFAKIFKLVCLLAYMKLLKEN